jgi:hypothetical protein
MEWVLYAGLALVAIVAIRSLLTRITAQGGTSDRDPAATVNQILAEADAFRGSRSPDDRPWDGQKRMASPTQDGGGVGG